MSLGLRFDRSDTLSAAMPLGHLLALYRRTMHVPLMPLNPDSRLQDTLVIEALIHTPAFRVSEMQTKKRRALQPDLLDLRTSIYAD